MRSSFGLALTFLVPIAACGHNTPPAPVETAGPAATVAPGAPGAPGAALPAVAAPTYRGADKPTAPVTLSVTARSLGVSADAERFEIILTATPERGLAQLDLAIDGRIAQGAAARAPAAGVPQVTTAIVEVARGTGRDVIGSAAVIVDGRRMTRAASVRVGAPAPVVPSTTIHLTDGTAVQEVRQ